MLPNNKNKNEHPISLVKITVSKKDVTTIPLKLKILMDTHVRQMASRRGLNWCFKKNCLDVYSWKESLFLFY